jgi:hypothetical protein
MPTNEDQPGRAPVTTADVTRAVQFATAALGGAPAEAWGNQAGTLDWTCWETVEHIADDLFAYATQLTPATPPGGYIPIAMTSARPDGPQSAIHIDPSSGAASLLQAVEACGALLVAMITTSSPDTRAWHPEGISDPEGFAAMGVTETLVHGYDVAQGLGVPWEPPADLCARVLSRLFPSVPAEPLPWPAFLWATGRADLPDRPRLADWHWHAEPTP